MKVTGKLNKRNHLAVVVFWGSGAADRIRTCGLRFRRPTLYPTELQPQLGGLSQTPGNTVNEGVVIY
jgi:hypothetical protein